jgi:hypothetical protein
MTAYNLKPPDTLPPFAWQEAKEKRKQALAAVRQRRAGLYHRLQNRKKAMNPGYYQDLIEIDAV